MMDSRVDSTRWCGEAIAGARAADVWLQMSTATIYADRRTRPTEATGSSAARPGVPDYWEYSVRIARREAAQQEAACRAPAGSRCARRW